MINIVYGEIQSKPHCIFLWYGEKEIKVMITKHHEKSLW